MTKAKLARAIRAIEEHGVLLVYPLKNRKDPASLWHVLHPRSEMRWSWDDSADPRCCAVETAMGPALRFAPAWREETEMSELDLQPSMPMEFRLPDASDLRTAPVPDDHPLLRELKTTLPDLDSRAIKAVLEALPRAFVKLMAPSSEVELPGLLSIAVLEIPPLTPRQGINPFTKQPMTVGGGPPRFAFRIASFLDDRFREVDDDDMIDEMIELRPQARKKKKR